MYDINYLLRLWAFPLVPLVEGLLSELPYRVAQWADNGQCISLEAAWKPRVCPECNQSMSKASLQGSAAPATAARPRPLLVETILNISRILLHTMYIWLLEAGNLARSVPQGSSRICIGLLGALEYESGKHFLGGALLTSQVPRLAFN